MTSVPQAFAGVGERGLPPHRLREEKRGRAQVTHRRGKLSLHTPVTRPSCPPSRQPGSSWGSQAHTRHPLSLMQGPQPERDPTDTTEGNRPCEVVLQPRLGRAEEGSGRGRPPRGPADGLLPPRGPGGTNSTQGCTRPTS